MKRPMFSIIVVSLNAGHKLQQTVESILQQKYTDYQVVVKDGGSGDGSIEKLEEVLSTYPDHVKDLVRIYREKDSSIYDGMNQAVEKATGDYLYFLNCGDYFYDETVLGQVADLIRRHGREKDSELTLDETSRQNSDETSGRNLEQTSGQRGRIFYGNIYDALRESVVASNPKINGFACYRNVPCHQACFYDRRLFAKRGYEPKYRVRADYEHFLYSFYEEKAETCYMPVVLASYEGGGFSETPENRKKSEKERREIVAKYMSLPSRFWYRSILVLTLAPLRTKIAESPKMGGVYQKVKQWIYGKKNS